jgi:hypothetical protein
MPTVQPIVQPVVQSVASGQVADQQVGIEGRTLTDVGAPQVIPQYDQSHSPSLPAPQGNADPIVSQMAFIGEAMGGDLYYEPDTSGLGDMWADPSAHGVDQGASAYYHSNYAPDIGQPYTANTHTQGTDYTKFYNPDGTLVYNDGPRTANDIQSSNAADINQGIGYYVAFNERPLYNSLATVAPNANPSTGGVFYPNAAYSDMWNNDGGIATTYVSPADPQMNAAPPASAEPLGWGF